MHDDGHFGVALIFEKLYRETLLVSQKVVYEFSKWMPGTEIERFDSGCLRLAILCDKTQLPLSSQPTVRGVEYSSG